MKMFLSHIYSIEFELQNQMEQQINQMDFDIAVNSFYDEILAKLQYLNNIEIEFLRRFQCEIDHPSSHASLVYYIRNIVKLIEQTYKDLKSYFDELKLNHLYDYFRKIQVLMVNGFNFLSHALLIHIDHSEQEMEHKIKAQEKEKMIIELRQAQEKQQKKGILSKEQAVQLEHYDFAINFYENEQAKINEELHKIQDNIMLSKCLVDKLQPSKAVKQLEQIKVNAQITLQNTEKIFEESYQLKYLEFKHYLSKMQKPEDLTKDFCDNIKISMKDKFTTGMKKTMNSLYAIKKEEEEAKQVEGSCQTELIEFSSVRIQQKAPLPKNQQKIQNLLLKQRKITEKLLGDLQLLRKETEFATSQKLRLQELNKSIQQQNHGLKQNYSILTKLYEDKCEQGNILKNLLKASQITLEKMRYYEIKFHHGVETVDFTVQTNSNGQDAEVQVDTQDADIISILKKTNDKIGEKLRNSQLQLRQIERKYTINKVQKMSKMRISKIMILQQINDIQKQIAAEKLERNQQDSSSESENSFTHTGNSNNQISSQIIYPSDEEVNLERATKIIPKITAYGNRPSYFMPESKVMKLTKNENMAHELLTHQQSCEVQTQTEGQTSNEDTRNAESSQKQIQTDLTFMNQSKLLSLQADCKKSSIIPKRNILDILTHRLQQKSGTFRKTHIPKGLRQRCFNATAEYSTNMNETLDGEFYESVQQNIDNSERYYKNTFQKLNLESNELKSNEKRITKERQFILDFTKKGKQLINSKNQCNNTSLIKEIKNLEGPQDKQHLLYIEKINSMANKQVRNSKPDIIPPRWKKSLQRRGHILHN